MRLKTCVLGLLIPGLLGGWTAAQTEPIAQDSEEWERIRSEAESQYEMVLLLIENKKFEEAVKTAKEIFSLPVPPEKHELLFDSATEISDALLHHKQYESALQVLDFCFAAVSEAMIQSKLHKEKAYIFKKMGRDDEALIHFEKSIELSKKANS